MVQAQSGTREGPEVPKCRGTVREAAASDHLLRPQLFQRADDILAGVTFQLIEAVPACPPAAEAAIKWEQAASRGGEPTRGAQKADRRLVVQECRFDDVARETWDALVDRAPAATPFSRWAFHRAWWDGYGATAHDQTLVVTDASSTAGDSLPVAIVPLMHRHEVEPSDAETRSTLRHGNDHGLTPVEPTAKAIFFGASYHSDYATVLAAPADLPEVARATVGHLAMMPASGHPHPAPWDVVDLRRLRCADPAVDALAEAFGAAAPASRWDVVREREDVCPILTLPERADFDGYLDSLAKKTRHEIRRKLRRAQSRGEVRFEESTDPLRDLDWFIQLHQRRWGDAGLFPSNPGGDASRVFIRRLFETFGPHGMVRLSFMSIDGRRVAAGIHLDDGRTIYFYNAGVDPDAKDLSPGVVLIAHYVEAAIALGRQRLDFLRGDESYKYDWGAVDEPIQRLLVRRTGH
jgi:CelD/BcsL family acetyltransferase involved in cellulose biosynthesis